MKILQRFTADSTLTNTYTKVFGYIRVSDVKQDLGVSKEAQVEAIVRYAQQNNLKVVSWFEETQTAAKAGRPKFNTMIARIENGEAHGCVFHKLDRSSRNFGDWERLMKLHENGVEIHFAHESLNLNERSGRLSADIQLVMASDYIRNLKQEVVKGMYGRLKQGLYPWGAPLGYLNQGKGKVKTIDKERVNYIRKLFKLYSTGKYNAQDLVGIMYTLGLRTRKGGKVQLQALLSILRNPFYCGIMKVKNEHYQGIHKPIIPVSLFKKVDTIRKQRTNRNKATKHNYLFSRMITCQCGRSLIAERQKGNVYYRCHIKTCAMTGIREEVIESKITDIIRMISFSDNEAKELLMLLDKEYVQVKEKAEKEIHSLRLANKKIDQQLDKLLDAYINNEVQKELFDQKKLKLYQDKELNKEKINELSRKNPAIYQDIAQFLELLNCLTRQYDSAILEEKREIVQNLTSNLSIHEKKLCISIASPYSELVIGHNSEQCALTQVGHRTRKVSIKWFIRLCTENIQKIRICC